jgi:hypothetical protein
MSSVSGKLFRQYSEEIVRNFLQTVVVVDDRAYFQKTESSTRPTTLKGSPARPRFTGASSDPEKITIGEQGKVSDSFSPTEAPVIDEAETPEETSIDLAHELNAKSLIESFAERGMLCAVIRPSEFEVEALGNKLYPPAKRSDIVMLDWVLHGDTEGKKITEIIAGLTETPSDNDRRLRLIVVYTGESNLQGIVDDIERVLRTSGTANVARIDPYTLVSGAVRITVFAKNNVRTVNELLERVVPVDELPDKLISEFTEMTMGLVSNVALESFAALRLNTHRILSKFHPGMDAPFLAHRAMLPQPEDANQLLVYLVGAELTAVLDGYEVGNIADERKGNDIIRAWVEKKEADGIKFSERFQVSDDSEGLGALCDLLRKGVVEGALPGQSATQREKVTKDPHKADLTGKLAEDKTSGTILDEEFAALTSLKSDYRVRPPALFPGSILKEMPPTGAEQLFKYWVCIQPICDCVRISESRSFPFLELVVVESARKFDVVLPDDQRRFIHVKIVFRPFKSRMVDFDPSEDGSQTVRAINQDDGIYFTAKDGTRYRWIADLKFEHAQRVINKYASELSRVGLEESEWLRRWST